MAPADIPSMEHLFRTLTNLNIGLLILAGAIALAIGGFALWSDRVGDRLLKAKDDQLKRELKDKDDHIAEVEGNARTESARIEGEAKKEVARLKGEAEKLREQNLETEAKLEKERQTRLEMEETISPRLMGIGPAFPKIDGLREFKGVKFDVEVILENEARRAAGMLAFVLKQAGWVPGNMSTMMDGNLPAGVTLLNRTHAGIPTTESAADRSTDAALALEEFLRAWKWDVQRLPQLDNSEARAKRGELPAEFIPPPPNTVIIKIGAKPDWYFFPPEIRDAMKKEQQFRAQDMQREKKLRQQLREIDKEYLSPPPPKK